MKDNRIELENLNIVVETVIDFNEEYEAEIKIELENEVRPIRLLYSLQDREKSKLTIKILGSDSPIVELFFDPKKRQQAKRTLKEEIISNDFIENCIDTHFIQKNKSNNQIKSVEYLYSKHIIDFWGSVFKSKSEDLVKITNTLNLISKNTENLIENINELMESKSGNAISKHLITFLIDKKLALKDHLYITNDNNQNQLTSLFKSLLNQVKPNQLSKIDQCHVVDQFIDQLIVKNHKNATPFEMENRYNTNIELFVVNPVPEMFRNEKKLQQENAVKKVVSSGARPR